VSRWREFGWVVCLAGLPLSSFLPLALKVSSQDLDLWHTQALWAYAGLAWAVGDTWTRPGIRRANNLALRFWLWWVGLSSLWWTTFRLLKEHQHNIGLWMSCLHLVVLGLWYLTATASWTPQLVERLTTACAWVAVGLAAYGILQVMGFDQLFMNIGDRGGRNHRAIGTIGNPAHFGVYLSLALPAMWRLRWKWAGMSLAGLALYLTKSQGAWLAAGAAFVWMLALRKRWWAIAGVGVVASLGLVLAWDELSLSLTNRLARWAMLWGLVEQAPLTGHGPGALFLLSTVIQNPEHPLWHWRHAHNEWLQVWLEQGIIGVGLLTWLVIHTFRQAWQLRTHPTGLVLGSVFVAFVMNSVYHFPAHLWMLGGWGLLALCGLEVLHAARYA